MKKMLLGFGIGALALALTTSASLGRGGRAVGGGGGGYAGGAVHSYGGGYGGGSGAGYRAGGSVVGPAGGSAAYGRGSGSYTTKGGSTIDYRGAAIGGTTPGGISGGRYVGGVNVTTPGGKDFTHVGTGGAVSGPGGYGAAGRSGASWGTGPDGSFATRSQGGVAVGPHGAVGGATRAGVVGGPGGIYAGGSRSVGAVGPYGAIGARTTVATGPHGTYYRNTTAIRTQGVYVRSAAVAYPCFRSGWYVNNPAAWFAAGWASASTVWRIPTWNNFVAYGYPVQPIYYDYGDNIVYETNNVYVNGEPAGTPAQFAQDAAALADAGRKADAPRDDEWLPLGVFAMVQGDEKTSNSIFQFAVNKKGVLRGTYYDALMDASYPITGSVDQKTQRAAWTVGDRKTPVYEAGIANFTKDATTMMAHYGNDRSVQFTLVRLEEPTGADAAGAEPKQ